jgi:hypothetical protein
MPVNAIRRVTTRKTDAVILVSAVLKFRRRKIATRAAGKSSLKHAYPWRIAKASRSSARSARPISREAGSRERRRWR